MGVQLPDISRREFSLGLGSCSPEPVAALTEERLLAHYRELRRWNPVLSLVGPGTAEHVAERHYGESLAALPLIHPGARTLLDLGSGAGFPGFVLAAARPDLKVTLVEAQERKWSFLKSACRQASLSCCCLNARFGLALPADFPENYDLVSCRAVRFSPREMEVVAERLAPGGAFVFWRGASDRPLPVGWIKERSVPIVGSTHRRVLRVRPAAYQLVGKGTRG